MRKLIIILVLQLTSAMAWAELRLMVSFSEPSIQYQLYPSKMELISPQVSQRGLAIFQFYEEVPSAQRQSVYESLKQRPEVRFVEWDQAIQGPQKNQPALSFASEADHWRRAINLSPVSNHQADCTRVVVAVLDSGMDIDHPDLINNFYQGWNAINPGASLSDGLGHGTHVAGIIAGQGIVDDRVQGVCQQARLMPLKFLDDFGNGHISNAIQAIYYLLDHKEIHPQFRYVMTNAWIAPPSQALRLAIRDAVEEGVLVVNAAGNAGQDLALSPGYPAVLAAEYMGVLSIAAIDTRQGLLDAFELDRGSNWNLEAVNIAAPGVGILSTAPDGTYAEDGGTSMAAAVVSGLAALVWSQNTSLSAKQVQALLETYVTSSSKLTGLLRSPGIPDAQVLIAQAFSAPPFLGRLVESGSGIFIEGVNLFNMDGLWLNQEKEISFNLLNDQRLELTDPNKLTCGYLRVGSSSAHQGVYLDLQPLLPSEISLEPVDAFEQQLVWNLDTHFDFLSVTTADNRNWQWDASESQASLFNLEPGLELEIRAGLNCLQPDHQTFEVRYSDSVVYSVQEQRAKNELWACELEGCSASPGAYYWRSADDRMNVNLTLLDDGRRIFNVEAEQQQQTVRYTLHGADDSEAGVSKYNDEFVPYLTVNQNDLVYLFRSLGSDRFEITIRRESGRETRVLVRPSSDIELLDNGVLYIVANENVGVRVHSSLAGEQVLVNTGAAEETQASPLLKSLIPSGALVEITGSEIKLEMTVISDELVF